MTLQEFAKILTSADAKQCISNVEIVEDEYTSQCLTSTVNFQESPHVRQYEIECTLTYLLIIERRCI